MPAIRIPIPPYQVVIRLARYGAKFPWVVEVQEHIVNTRIGSRFYCYTIGRFKKKLKANVFAKNREAFYKKYNDKLDRFVDEVKFSAVTSEDRLQREASPACTWCESLSEWGACQGHPGL
jgi:hypothetical protein